MFEEQYTVDVCWCVEEKCRLTGSWWMLMLLLSLSAARCQMSGTCLALAIDRLAPGCWRSHTMRPHVPTCLLTASLALLARAADADATVRCLTYTAPVMVVKDTLAILGGSRNSSHQHRCHRRRSACGVGARTTI